MARGHYEQDLRDIQERLVTLGTLVAQQLRQSVSALQRYDAAWAAIIVNNDNQIDDLHQDIEQLAITILALQQPVARDLRIIIAVIAIAGELERIGDYAKGIAKRVRRITSAPRLLVTPQALLRLSQLAQEMLESSISAFIDQDASAAQRLALIDDAADAAEEDVMAQVRAIVTADGSFFESGQALIDIAHALERVADRATNIAERIVYLATAETEVLN